MVFYPAFLDIRGLSVVVIGGGNVAARKIGSLLEAGAKVLVVAPQACGPVAAWAASGAIELAARPFRPADLDGARLVFCAAGDPAVNGQAAELARQKGVWVNVIQQPEQGDFNVPAHFRRGDLLVALGTGGASPAVARRLRQELELRFGPEWAPYLRILAAARRVVIARGLPEAENRRMFYALADSDLLGLCAARDTAGIERLLGLLLEPGADLAALGLDPDTLWNQEEDGR